MKEIIKTLAVVTGLLTLAAGRAQASLDIPDGNPVGVADMVAATTTGSGAYIGSVTVTLDITGGNNGDLYAYLSYNGAAVALFNQPGVTTSDPLGDLNAGYNVTVAASGGIGNLSTAGSTSSSAQVGGIYNVAGLSGYDGMAAGGTWTLFIADMAGGDPSDSVLQSFGVSEELVPEPVTWALIVFALFGAAARLAVWRLRKKTVRPQNI